MDSESCLSRFKWCAEKNEHVKTMMLAINTVDQIGNPHGSRLSRHGQHVFVNTFTKCMSETTSLTIFMWLTCEDTQSDCLAQIILALVSIAQCRFEPIQTYTYQAHDLTIQIALCNANNIYRNNGCKFDAFHAT